MIAYLVESTLILLLLLGAYKLLLEGEKAYQFNRFFLIGALIFGLTAPLVSVDINIFNSVPRVEYESFQPLVAENELPVMQTESSDSSTDTDLTSTANAEQSEKPVAAEIKNENTISLSDILMGLYFLGLGFWGLRLGIGLRTLFSSLSDYETTVYKGTKIFLTDHSISPFTVFSRIFISKEDFETGEISETILEYELTHARQLHTLDVLFIEVLKIVFWFNPVFYFYKSAIQLNHEFIADDNVISNSKDVGGYQKLILKMVSRSSGLSFSSSFNYPSTKKRFKMMIKNTSPLRSFSKRMLLLPILMATTLMFCTNKNENDYSRKITDNNDALYSTVDLYFDNDRAEELGLLKDGPMIKFDKSGTPFTGTQQYRYVVNDSLFSETIYVDGITTSTTAYHKDGSLMGKYEFGYVEDKFWATKHYNEDGLLIEEWQTPESEDSLGYIKQWHQNGQLKFEMTYKKGMKYHGLMTLYDEEGEIIEQERYEDGKLVEKIK
ncbi:MAG TPA: M56 family metallopeptidase [Gracilimonas sp.]|uniref:M56 family metallopeptidase n=1 Tax=Gracilimonas sp. TaxID=1974203 RepID=UPI002D84ACCE|nr:M56 family metallopeptidase [Gracilimonas sp.]